MIKRNLFLWVIVLNLSALSILVASAEVVCDLCGEAIQGNYLEYRNQHLHIHVCQSCNKKQPRCVACNIPSLAGDLTYSHGERLCSSCIKTAQYCIICTKRIEGQYYQVKDRPETYCGRCYRAYPKCKVCGLPRQPAQINPSTQVCHACTPNLKHCAACNNPITDVYFAYEFSEGLYCQDCHKNRAKCHVCGVPVGRQYWKYPDGRAVCLKCNERAIIDVNKIEEITYEVQKLLESQLGMNINDPFDLHIQALNNNTFLKAKNVKIGTTQGNVLHGKELGLYRRHGSQSEIFLLYGIPIELVYETAAHELAHAWQAENCNLSQSLETKEGFAQWVAAQVLKLKGFNRALIKLESRNDHPYGTGYKKFKAVEQNLGKHLVLEYAKK
jgi:hypothetical protein